jgi:hypothetical protein
LRGLRQIEGDDVTVRDIAFRRLSDVDGSHVRPLIAFMRPSYESSFAILKDRVEIIGDEQPVVDHPPRHDDDNPGPSIFRLMLQDVSLADLTIPGLYVGRSELTRVSFNGTDLHFSTINWSDIVNCDFRGSILSRSDLRACQFVGCLFQSADLTGADLRLSSFQDCSFDNAIMSETMLYRPRKLFGLFKSDPGQDSLSLSASQRSQIKWCCAAPEPGGG